MLAVPPLFFDISAYPGSPSGNTFSQPQEPFESSEPRVLHGGLKELSLNNVGFLQQEAIKGHGNLSWEFVSRLFLFKPWNFPALTI